MNDWFQLSLQGAIYTFCQAIYFIFMTAFIVGMSMIYNILVEIRDELRKK